MTQTAMIENEAKLSTLFRHTVHPEWGAGVMAWKRDDKYGFQFEDGRIRVFKDGYLHLLEEVDLPLHRSSSICAQLNRKLGLAEVVPAAKAAARTNAMSFEDQLRVFAHLYPKGFADPAWISDHRDNGNKKRLKRHRDPSIEKARAALTASSLDTLITEGKHDDAWKMAVALIDGTDLVSSQQRKALTTINPSARAGLTTSLRDLLWGEELFDIRFERFVGTLAAAMHDEPTWQLATVLLALVHPDEHVCVRPTSFRAQAAWMAPSLVYSKTPNADLYARFRRMAAAVRAELESAGHEPRDLLDVYDFMWATLRPKAKAVLDELRAAAAPLQNAA